MMGTINSFSGDNFFLSNFYKCPVEYNGIKYGHTEGAFQAQKTLLEGERQYISMLNPSQAKKACGRYGLNGFKIQLRPDWEQVKDKIMYEVLVAKFTQNKDLAEKLLATGNSTLIEGNTWHDNYWGDCVCNECKNIYGKNQLGITLMKIREQLKSGEI